MDNTVLEWPLIIYGIVVLGLVGFIALLSHFLGERHHGREKHEPFESGVKTTGMARIRFSTQFYLIAILFVIFDLEAVFLFAWAIANPDAGWTGFITAAVFMFILFAALVYEWAVGALEIPNQRKGRTKQFLQSQSKSHKE